MAKSKKLKTKRVWMLVILLFVIIGAGFVLARHLTAAKFSNSISPSASPSATPINRGTGNTSTAPVSASSSKAPTLSPAQSAPQAPPAAPTGDLLNLHQVSASASTKLESSCQTSAHYSCSVQATNSSTGKVIVVGTETADSTGAAIIDWSGKVVGVGTWTIRLIATDGAQSTPSVAYDQLEVTQ